MFAKYSAWSATHTVYILLPLDADYRSVSMTYNVSLPFFSPPETDNSAKAVKETALFFSDFSLIVTGDTSASGCDTQSPVTFSGINGATVLGN